MESPGIYICMYLKFDAAIFPEFCVPLGPSSHVPMAHHLMSVRPFHDAVVVNCNTSV